VARPPRLEHPGALWYVAVRGAGRIEPFPGDAERRELLALLGRTARLWGWRVHAFSVLPAGFELLVETPEPTLSRGMRDLNGVATQRLNRRRGRPGPLFAGRFRAVLVERETHLLEVARWVVLAPVRAGLARSAADWPFSSFGATAGEVPSPDWLETGATLAALARRPHDARRLWWRVVEDPRATGADPWSGLKGQVFLGSESFARDAVRRATRRRPASGTERGAEPRPVAEVAAAFAATRGVSPEDLGESPRRRIVDRALLAWALRRRARAPLGRIAETLGVGIAQASVLARRGETLAAGDARLAALVEEL